ncbi:MAG: alpha-galactosidase [Armatimonadota bacterium]
MSTDFIPAESPKDSINASPSSIRQVLDWAQVVFGGTSVKHVDEAVNDFLLPTAAVPFSFKYGGVASSEFISKWERKVEKKDKADRVCYVTSFKDPSTGLVVTATATAFKQYSAVEWLLNFENTGSADTPIIEDIRTTDISLLTTEAKAPVVLHQLHGDSCGEKSFLPFDSTLESGKNMTIAPTLGRPSQETAFPFWNFQYGNRGFVTAIGWSGQWSAWFDRDLDGITRFRAGMEKTHLLLHPREKIRTPRVLMMSWEGDKQAAQNCFRRLMLFKYVPQENNKPLRLPICLQTFDRYNWTTSWWPTEQGQLEAVKAAHELGCDTYWFDAGWFVGNFPNGVGNWFHKPKEFPNGVKPIGDLCKSYDMDFVLWFEPCRVAPDTQIAREHPEFVFGGDNITLYNLGQSGGLYNLGNPDALRWMTDLLSERISEYGVTVYREDFNIDPLGFWRSNDASDRQGMNEIRFVEGHYAMWDELREKHPGLWIDNCASGGRRIDLETCMRSIPLWRSDTGCSPGHPEWNQMQSVALSQFVPLNTASAWEPERSTIRTSATAGLVCEFAYPDPEFPMETAKAILDEVRENRKYWYGDMYPLTSINTAQDQFFAYQLHRADLNEGMVMAFRRIQCSALGLIVALNAVDPKTKYKVEFIDNAGQKTTRNMTGEDMMHSGLQLRIAEKFGSLLVRYKPAGMK